MQQKLLTILFLVFIFTISALFISCSEDSTTNPPGTTVDPHTVQGYVKSANGSVNITGATVRVVTATDIDTTVTTDANGFYKITGVQNGNYLITFTKGSFSDSANVTVPVSNNIPDANLLPNKRLAFYWGDYDQIQNIIRNLGYGAYLDSFQLADFSNAALLNNYSIIFINCGSSSRDDLATAQISNNLTNFLNAGGKIYASDWAFGCVKGIHPELDGVYEGDAADSVNANVVHTGLQTALGKSSVKINYNLPSWLTIDPAINTTINIPFLRASYNVNGTPVNNNVIAFYRNEGGTGKLLYTTFHEEAQVTGDMTKILQYFVFEL